MGLEGFTPDALAWEADRLSYAALPREQQVWFDRIAEHVEREAFSNDAIHEGCVPESEAYDTLDLEREFNNGWEEAKEAALKLLRGAYQATDPMREGGQRNTLAALGRQVAALDHDDDPEEATS